MESDMTATKFYIFPYAQGSEGAKLLAEELGCKRILREGSTFNKKATDVVINWGASDCPAKYAALNKDIKGILNKKTFFERLKDTGLTPKFETTQMNAADNLGFPILCRTKLEGKDGEGIVIAEKFSQLVPRSSIRSTRTRRPNIVSTSVGILHRAIPSSAPRRRSRRPSTKATRRRLTPD
jgi:hypothetical protein